MSAFRFFNCAEIRGDPCMRRYIRAVITNYRSNVEAHSSSSVRLSLHEGHLRKLVPYRRSGIVPQWYPPPPVFHKCPGLSSGKGRSSDLCPQLHLAAPVAQKLRKAPGPKMGGVGMPASRDLTPPIFSFMAERLSWCNHLSDLRVPLYFVIHQIKGGNYVSNHLSNLRVPL